ncbi:hypothetical protein BDP55DRAFT_752714 [Colletotrichum godetiae]|uniref:Uncharacterized protein n=1 Tax=Colletotrichum godetiae TaxID=1209918 RepID=A0AAJ0AE24_9PEZI|nr:uncharacterized protein BDP55DRAFT_752714 [Colletotrichum godetiae]KAK1671519.1 hypothetical protein BDP55DRAFT_752714 [Colletotrichum godetiae]
MRTMGPCGTMGLEEVPLQLLMHLSVSFGYITDAFLLTRMDVIDTELYKSIGNVEARNLNLKIVIAV